ncbi:MAG: N-formylglutamate amidohydrolase [Desulfosarcina sp.]
MKTTAKCPSGAGSDGSGLTPDDGPGLVDRFSSRQTVHGVDPEDGFAYQLDPAVPYIATAIHAGSRMRQELEPLMAISSQARGLEEDTATDRMIRGLPSAIWGLDSRAEYDLNRPAERAIPLTPEGFWGLQVYKRRPNAAMIQKSLAKYHAFYRFVERWIKRLLDRYGFCLVYDLHAYNIRRQRHQGIDDPPVFNLGTALLDRRRWHAAIEGWLKELGAIRLPDHAVTVAENRVFKGHGEFCRRLTAWDPRILVLPTEISKIFMDEASGQVHTPVVAALAEGIQRAVGRHSRRCLNESTASDARRPPSVRRSPMD